MLNELVQQVGIPDLTDLLNNNGPEIIIIWYLFKGLQDKIDKIVQIQAEQVKAMTMLYDLVKIVLSDGKKRRDD